MNFGALRVVNDDFVQPRAGFGSHPHRDAEIFSYVLDGKLSHQDSMGHKEALGRGCVQYMSAGTGVVHSVSVCACMLCCTCEELAVNLGMQQQLMQRWFPSHANSVQANHSTCMGAIPTTRDTCAACCFAPRRK
jgi:hypothetical protein